MIRIKRAYEPASPEDGTRILVDRLWPRGVTKEELKIALWAKQLAPSNELRKWFHHESGSWPEFERRYRQELELQDEGLRELADRAASQTITLVYSAKDESRNQAIVLRDVLTNLH